MQMVNKLQIISILDDDNLGRPDLILNNTDSIIEYFKSMLRYYKSKPAEKIVKVYDSYPGEEKEKETIIDDKETVRVYVTFDYIKNHLNNKEKRTLFSKKIYITLKEFYNEDFLNKKLKLGDGPETLFNDYISIGYITYDLDVVFLEPSSISKDFIRKITEIRMFEMLYESTDNLVYYWCSHTGINFEEYLYYDQDKRATKRNWNLKKDKSKADENWENHPYRYILIRGLKRLLEAKEFATSLKSLFKVGKIVPMYKGIPDDKEISKKELGKVSIILSEEEK